MLTSLEQIGKEQEQRLPFLYPLRVFSCSFQDTTLLAKVQQHTCLGWRRVLWEQGLCAFQVRNDFPGFVVTCLLIVELVDLESLLLASWRITPASALCCSELVSSQKHQRLAVANPCCFLPGKHLTCTESAPCRSSKMVCLVPNYLNSEVSGVLWLGSGRSTSSEISLRLVQAVT